MGQAIDLLKEAREIVRAQPLTPKVAALRAAADDLHEAYDILKVALTRSTIPPFVAAVTRTLLAIERIHAGDDPGPKSGTGTSGGSQDSDALDPVDKLLAQG
jgi:hypothetical protein